MTVIIKVVAIAMTIAVLSTIIIHSSIFEGQRNNRRAFNINLCIKTDYKRVYVYKFAIRRD